MALSDTKVRALKPRDKLYKVSDDRGLYLEVRPNGSRLWRYRYFLHGKDKRIALGAYPVVGLATPAGSETMRSAVSKTASIRFSAADVRSSPRR